MDKTTAESVQRLLLGHVSQETAYHVMDYPYGFRLRCQVRYWLEFNAKHGFRLWSQTSNPKRGNVWNKPKASTYARFGGCMYLDFAGHVQWAALSEYCNATEARAFLTTFGPGVPADGLELLRRWVAAKEAYDANRKPSDPLEQGTAEAAKAFVAPLDNAESDFNE